MSEYLEDGIGFFHSLEDGKARPVEFDDGLIIYDCPTLAYRRYLNRQRVARDSSDSYRSHRQNEFDCKLSNLSTPPPLLEMPRFIRWKRDPK